MEKEDIVFILKLIFILIILTLSIFAYFKGYEIGSSIWSIEYYQNQH